jgi:hypothetical protein
LANAAAQRSLNNLRKDSESPMSPSGGFGKSAELAARAIGSSKKSVERAITVRDRDPELFKVSANGFVVQGLTVEVHEKPPLGSGDINL